MLFLVDIKIFLVVPVEYSIPRSRNPRFSEPSTIGGTRFFVSFILVLFLTSENSFSISVVEFASLLPLILLRFLGRGAGWYNPVKI